MPFGVTFPTIEISGLLSQSWIYVAVISGISLFALVGLIIALFYFTYNIHVEVYENIGGGSKMVRTIRTRARKVKVSSSGEELLKLLRPSVYRTAYGIKIAPNTYAFGVGKDGYWRNISLGDLDTQMGILGVTPVDRDARLTHVAIEQIIKENYNPNKNVLIGMSIFLAVMTLIWLVGSYVVINKFGKNMEGQQEIANKQSETTRILADTSVIIANAKLQNEGIINTPTGLTPANTTGG